MHPLVGLALAGHQPEFNGESYRSPRNDTLQTPPGPEGSNGSCGFVCRGAAGTTCHPLLPLAIAYIPRDSELVNEPAAQLLHWWLKSQALWLIRL